MRKPEILPASSSPSWDSAAWEIRDGAVRIKLQVNGDYFSIRATPTRKYPHTGFRDAYWKVMGRSTRMLVDLSGIYTKEKTIRISTFFTKSSDVILVNMQKEEDRKIMRRLGREVFCTMLGMLPAGIIVTLEASGSMYPSIERKYNEEVEKLESDDIRIQLQTVSPLAYKNLLEDNDIDIGSEQNLSGSTLRLAWVQWKLTESLVKYYTNNYGFQRTTDKLIDFYYQPMQASKETITEKCRKPLRPGKRVRDES